MTIQRMDHVGVVVDDVEAAMAFFVDLGMELEGEAPVEGPRVDRVNGLDGVRVDIVMLRTPDGHGRLELSAGTASPPAPLPVRGRGGAGLSPSPCARANPY